MNKELIINNLQEDQEALERNAKRNGFFTEYDFGDYIAVMKHLYH